jgi:4-hydroxybenzoate polyprenyltransferase
VTVPLCVDLDGTLVRSNVLVETLVGALKQQPLVVFAVPFWLARGRAALKRELAARADIDVSRLPYDDKVLADIRRERLAGRSVYLATAADEAIARRIADHLGLFDDVVASNGRENLKGEAKARALAARFGEKGFDYVGNDRHDVAVWNRAREAIRVERRAHPFAALARALRPLHWAKNLLVFLPLAAAHRILDRDGFILALEAFVAFCFVASAVYLANDLADLQDDRRHPAKRLRAVASGDIPIEAALILVPVLLVLGGAIAWRLPPAFGALLAAYVAVNALYSIGLKRVALVDVFVLAGFYTLRILAGGAATGVPVSHWLLALSLFGFLSLALAKRYVEVSALAARAETHARGRGYLAGDAQVLGWLGVASGCLSVLVLALYITSRDVTALYSRPELLWFACPLMLYWISRVWLLAHRGELHEDPLVFALRDPSSYTVAVATIVVMVAAS